MKDAHPHASNREYILEQIRQCRQREGEAIVGRLRDLLEKGLSEDSSDTEYQRAAVLALKKGVGNDVVYVQLLQLSREASFEELATQAIASEQEFRMRHRGSHSSKEKDSSLVEGDLIE